MPLPHTSWHSRKQMQWLWKMLFEDVSLGRTKKKRKKTHPVLWTNEQPWQLKWSVPHNFMSRDICLLTAILRESSWVLMWLSFAGRYGDIFHRQLFQRSLSQTANQGSQGIHVEGEQLSQTLLLQREGLAHAHKLLRPQWEHSWELSRQMPWEMDWISTCCPEHNDFLWVLTMLENTGAIKQVEKGAVQQRRWWCLLMQSCTASSDRTHRVSRQQRRHSSSNECAREAERQAGLCVTAAPEQSLVCVPQPFPSGSRVRGCQVL